MGIFKIDKYYNTSINIKTNFNMCKCNHNGPVHHHHLHYHDHDESNGNLIHHDLIIPLNLPHHHNHISPNIKDERIKPLKIICDEDIQFDGSENSNINNNNINLNDLSERKRRLSSNNNNNNNKCFVSDMNFKKLNLNSNNDNIGNRNHLVQRLPHLHSHNISRGKPRVPHLHNHAHHHGHHHNHHHQQNHNHNHLTVSNNVAALGRSTTNSSTPGSSSSSSSSSASSPGYSSSDLHSDNESKYKIKNEYDELDLSAAQFTIAKPCKWVNKDGDVDTINDENNDDSHEHDDEKFESKCDGFNFHSNDELYKHLLEDHIQHNHDHDHHHHHEQQDAKPVVKKEEDGDTHLFNNDEHVYSCEWLGCMFSSNRLEDLLDHVPKSHGFTSDMIKKSENDFILTETGNYIPKLKSQIKTENNNNGTGNNGLDVVDEDDHDCSEECHHVCEWITNQTEVTQNGATPIKCGEVFKETGDLTNHIINKHIGSEAKDNKAFTYTYKT
ncbi:unnamed protein product [[Candida] boidinii]|nr:unnamed protein product [[Candida] boidinii]